MSVGMRRQPCRGSMVQRSREATWRVVWTIKYPGGTGAVLLALAVIVILRRRAERGASVYVHARRGADGAGARGRLRRWRRRRFSVLLARAGDHQHGADV